MKKFLNTNRYIIGGLLVGSLFMYGFSYLIVEDKLTPLQVTLESQLEAKGIEAGNLAVLIAQGGASPSAAMIVADCTIDERKQFDNRLGKLDTGLSKAELLELDNLFNRCASVQAMRRAVMVTQLEAIIAEHSRLLEQRKLLGSYEIVDTASAQWQLLLAAEKGISGLSFDQVTLQKEIIQDLLLGLDVSSAAANELREKGSAIQNELIALTNTAATIRATLVSK